MVKKLFLACKGSLNSVVTLTIAIQGVRCVVTPHKVLDVWSHLTGCQMYGHTLQGARCVVTPYKVPGVWSHLIFDF